MLGTFFLVKSFVFVGRQFKECNHIVSIKGGLGNQMHNYALGLSLYKETGKSVCYDVSYFYNEKYKVAHEDELLFSNFNLSNTKRIIYNKSNFEAVAFRLWMFFLKK